MKIAVIILNWNGKKWLDKFAEAVANSLPNNAELIVADNGSEDGSVEFLKNKFDNIRIIEFDKNYGFTGGYNKAIKQIDTEYIVLLNSDVETPKGWIEPLESFMDNNSDYAACQPKLMCFDDKNLFEYAGASGGFIDRYGYPFCRGRIFQNIEKDNGQYNDIVDVFWASGACLFIRKTDYVSIGGLDDGFFAHMEEIDLCWRLWNNGKKIAVVPQSVVYHVGGGSLPSSSAQKTFLNFKNNLHLIYKNYPIKRLKKVLFYRFFLDYLAAFTFLLQGNLGDMRAVFRGRKQFHKEKKISQKSISNEFPNTFYDGCILFDYYLKNKKTYSSLKK